MSKSELNEAIRVVRNIRNELWALDEVSDSKSLEKAEQILLYYIQKGWCEDE